jgi:hypothetical protein
MFPGAFTGLVSAAAVVVCLLMPHYACTPGGGIPPQTATDVVVGLNAAECILTTYSADIARGEAETAAIVDTTIKCGVTAAQATGLLGAHRKAMVVEGYVVRPDGGK